VFYCNKCKDKNKWPDSYVKSVGRCEMCGDAAVCNDVPSAYLPAPSEDN
jgi:hypothetical protein